MRKKCNKSLCIKYRKKGLLIPEIAEKLNIPQAEVYNAVCYTRVNTPNEIIEIKGLSDKGYSVSEIAQIVGKPESTINRLLSRKNIDIHIRNKFQMSEKEIELLKKMYVDGKSLNEICNKFNITRGALQYRLRTCKLSRDVKKMSDDKISEIKRLYKLGYSMRAISRELHISRNTVSKYLKKQQ